VTADGGAPASLCVGSRWARVVRNGCVGGARGGVGRRSCGRSSSPPTAFFPDAHADLSVELIANIKEVFGERGLDKLIEKRTGHQIVLYRTALASARDVER